MIEVALALMLSAQPASAMPRKPRIDKSMETDGQYGKITEAGHRVVQTPEQWEKLWRSLGKEPPQADFKDHFAVAAFAGTRNTGGYRIVFDEPREEKDAVVIRYAVVKPKGMMVTMSITHPYAVKLFPKTGKPVKVEAREE